MDFLNININRDKRKGERERKTSLNQLYRLEGTILKARSI